MSNKALDWAWDANVPSGPLFVLVVLGDHANDHSGEDWTCFPSVERIQARTRFSRATVERHLATLFAGGWISRKRRVRPDGRLGIYDYVLHREEAVRERLKAERAGAQEGSSDGEPCSNLQHGPCVSLQHGPCVNSEEAMLQIEGEPCRKLQHEEPLVEPSMNPQRGVGAGAGEPGDDGFEQAYAEFPDIGRQRSSPPAARATWALWCGEFDPAQLLSAIRRYKAEDPDVRRGVCLSFERWFSTERFRHWLGGGSPVEASATTPRTGFAGPAELRALIVRAVSNGEAFARSYFDPAAWDEATNTLTPATSMATQRLGELRRVFRDYGASIGAPVQPVGANGGKS